jgi:hypothetical protein
MRTIRFAAYLFAAAVASFTSHVAAQTLSPDFDIDGDGVCDAATDATLVARYLFGMRDQLLIANLPLIVNSAAAQTVASKITALGTALDVNNDGAVDALNDGLLLTRYALGINDATITNGVKAGSRNAAAIKTYLDGKCTPPQSAAPWPVWTGIVPTVPPSTTGITYYVDGTNGSDGNNGLTPTTAFKTIAKIIGIDQTTFSALIAAGDTVLIRKGLYREGISLINTVSGTAAKPITFGSYGDGEVILDGSAKVGPWAKVGTTGSIWRVANPFASTEFPVMVVVNEQALKQVPQVTFQSPFTNAPNAAGTTAHLVGLSGVTSGSGKWFYDQQFIYADMGGTDPNAADVIVQKYSQDQNHVFFYDKDYLRFKGLTIRGSGSNGVWGYGSNIIIENCDIKFNGKAAVAFLPLSTPGTNNSVLYSRAFQNVLVNWPRGNNGYALAGGSWPGAVSWSGNLNAVAKGNVVYLNGGEGIASYGTGGGQPSGSTMFEQNVMYDNWSVNMYFDNQPNNTARNNLIFNHPIDFNPATTNFIYVGPEFPYNQLGKFSVCVGLGDEQTSSDAVSNNYTNLANTKVYNNIIAGCRTGILDYGEGPITSLYHGMKNTLIANNTIIMPSNPNGFPGTGGVFGIRLQDNTATNGTNNNVGSVIANNIIVGYNNDALIFAGRTGPLLFSVGAEPLRGITLKNNVYFSASATPFGSGSNSTTSYNFASWKTNAGTGQEIGSLNQNPLLQNVAHFQSSAFARYQFRNAKPAAGSPAIGAGSTQTDFSNSFELTTRTAPWSIGAF